MTSYRRISPRCPTAANVVGESPLVFSQRGVVGDVAAAQRLNVAGDQRAAADGGAAGVEGGAEA